MNNNILNKAIPSSVALRGSYGSFGSYGSYGSGGSYGSLQNGSRYIDPYAHIINPFVIVNGYGINLI